MRHTVLSSRATWYLFNFMRQEELIDSPHRKDHSWRRRCRAGQHVQDRRQYVVEYHQTAQPRGEVLATSSSSQRFTRQSRYLRQAAWASADLWHKRLGHPGHAALAQVGRQALGVRLRGPSTAQCQECAMAKVTRQISRRPDPNKSTRPFHRVHINWFDLQEVWDGYQYDGRLVRRCVLMICEATGMTLSYFTACSKEDENLPIVRDAVN